MPSFKKRIIKDYKKRLFKRLFNRICYLDNELSDSDSIVVYPEIILDKNQQKELARLLGKDVHSLKRKLSNTVLFPDYVNELLPPLIYFQNLIDSGIQFKIRYIELNPTNEQRLSYLNTICSDLIELLDSYQLHFDKLKTSDFFKNHLKEGDIRNLNKYSEIELRTFSLKQILDKYSEDIKDDLPF